MDYELDSLQLITQQMEGTVGFIVYKPTNSNFHRINSTDQTGRDLFLDLPKAQIKWVLTVSFLKIMIHNNQYVCQVQLCSTKGCDDTIIGGDVVYLFLPLFEYACSYDLYNFFNKDKGTHKIGPPEVGNYVSILMQCSLESTTDDEIANDTYNDSFVSNSRLLQS